MNQRNLPPQKRTCYDLGVCQQRTPACQDCDCEPFNMLVMPTAPVEPVATAKPRTAWVFEIVFEKRDLILVAIVVAVAYIAARS